MDRNTILNKVKSETAKNDGASFVPKIIYGRDRLGNYFIYFKIKDYKKSVYADESFVLMYQNPKGMEQDVSDRQKSIIDFFRKTYILGKQRDFDGNKSHFFIKGKLYSSIDKMNSFYFGICKDLITYLNNCNLMDDIDKFDMNKFLNDPGLFNFCKKKNNGK